MKGEAIRSYRPEPLQVVEPPRELFGERKPSVLTFGKKAKPPPSGPPPESTPGVRGSEVGSRSQNSPVEDSTELPSFKKRAMPPPREMGLRGKELGYTGPRTSLRGGSSMSSREKSDLEKYYKDAFAIYSFFGTKGVALDLKEIIEKGQSQDDEKFKLLTAPSRASTGLGYSRMMRRFIDWRLGRRDLDGVDGSPDQKMGILDFTIHLVQIESGKMTPRAFLYAWEFLGIKLMDRIGGEPRGFRPSMRRSVRWECPKLRPSLRPR